MKKCIIIGASSGIGKEVAKIWIKRGYKLGLAARRLELLEELKALAPDRIEIAKLDVNDASSTTTLSTLIERVGGMDTMLYASGVGSQNYKLNEAVEIDIMQTNVIGFSRIIGFAFRFFEHQNSGHIAAITSIAGTKGLAPAPAYSASKALQTTYLQALEQLAHTRKLNIKITDLRPGFVRTAFLKDAYFPMCMSVETTAQTIVHAIDSQKHIAIIDWRWYIVTKLWSIIPNMIWRRLKLSI